MWRFGKQGRPEHSARRRRKPGCRRNRLSFRGGCLERLEDRRLLAITVAYDDVTGVLTFTGDTDNDQLTITSSDPTSSEVSFTSATDATVATVSPQSGVTAIVVNLDGGTNDSLTVNGSSDADTIAIDGITVTFVSGPLPGVTYTLTDVENLFVNGQNNNDALSVAGVSVAGQLSVNGGSGLDTLSVSGPLAAGSFTVDDLDGDNVEISGSGTARIITTSDQEYRVPVTLLRDTTLAGHDITFLRTIDSSSAFRSLEINTSGGGTTTFGQAVGRGLPLASLRTDSDGTTAINGGAVITIRDQIFNDVVILNEPSPARFFTTIFHSKSIREYDTTGRFLRAFTIAAPGNLRGVAYGPDGLLYAVVERRDGFDVVAVDGNGVIHETYSFPERAVRIRSYISAGKIAFDGRGHFYVGGVQFDIGLPNSGRLISEFDDVDVEVLPNGNVLLVDDYELVELTPSGSLVRNLIRREEGFLIGLRGVEYDPIENEVFVSMGGSTGFLFNLAKLDAETGVVYEATRYLSADDLWLTEDRRLIVASFSLPPGIFDLNLLPIGVFEGSEQMFVTESIGHFTYLKSASGNILFNGTLNSFQNNDQSLGIDACNNVAFNDTVGGADGGMLDNLTVTAGNNVTLTEVYAIDTVHLTASGDTIRDDADAAADVVARELIAGARSEVILDTAIDFLTIESATGVIINDLDDLTVNSVSATRDVHLTAGGAIEDGNANANNVTAEALIAKAVNGISLDATVRFLTAINTGSGGIDINGFGNTVLVEVSAPGQDVTFSNNANLAVESVTAGTANLTASRGLLHGRGVTATNLVTRAHTGILLGTAVQTLTATTTLGEIHFVERDDLNVLLASTSNGRVTFQTGGDLNVTSVMGDTANFTVDGAINDRNGGTLNVSARVLNAVANHGITLDTAVTQLTANNNISGDVVIREADGMKLLSGTNPGGNIVVTSISGALTVTDVNALGHLIVSTSDSVSVSDNLSVNGKVDAGGFISLIAGDDITLEGTSEVRSLGSFVYMKTDASSVDAAGGTLILLGMLQGDNSLQYPVVAEGDAGDDLFSVQKLPLSPIAILARGGALDNTFIVFTDAAEDIRVYATIVDLTGHPGIEITYVDNEQLDLVTLGGDDKVFVQMPEPDHGVLANIIRTSTGAGDDSLKINGSTLDETIRINSYTPDPNYRFQVRGDTGETECLQVFGFVGNDIIENAAPIASLLDGGNGQDAITGSDFSVHPVTGAEIYDVIFGGGDVDSILDQLVGRGGLSGRAGNDFIYADHDYNFGAPVLTPADGDLVNGGLGVDVVIALGADAVRRDTGDVETDVIFSQEPGISAQLQAGLAKRCARPIP